MVTKIKEVVSKIAQGHLNKLPIKWDFAGAETRGILIISGTLEITPIITHYAKFVYQAAAFSRRAQLTLSINGRDIAFGNTYDTLVAMAEDNLTII